METDMNKGVNGLNSDQTMSVAASALKAQQARMRIISENIANGASTGTTPGADPYRRQIPVFTAAQINGAMGVKLQQVRPDQTDFSLVFDPSHPAANAEGYVKKSNVNSLIEVIDMREAQRAYEANLNVIETARAMAGRTLDILNK
jgi:flagellar basal-body rod protein FlgC